MRGQKPPKEGIRRVGGRTRRVDVVMDQDHKIDENSSKKSFLRAELKVGGLSLVVGRMREHKTKAV